LTPPISELSDTRLWLLQKVGGNDAYPLNRVNREMKRRLGRKKRGTALDRLYHAVPDLQCRRSVEEWDRILPDIFSTTLTPPMAPDYYRAFRNSVLRVAAALAANRTVCRRPNVKTFPYIKYWIAVRRYLLLVVDAAAAAAVADEALQRALEKLDALRASTLRHPH
jgi:hypothetical protein